MEDKEKQPGQRSLLGTILPVGGAYAFGRKLPYWVNKHTGVGNWIQKNIHEKTPPGIHDIVQEQLNDLKKNNPHFEVFDQTIPHSAEDINRLKTRRLRDVLGSLPSSVLQSIKSKPEVFNNAKKEIEKIIDSSIFNSGPNYMANGFGSIVHGENDFATLHEIGHAKTDRFIRKISPRLSIARGIATNLGFKAWPIPALAAGLTGNEDYIPAIAAAGFAPQLLDEGMASAHALKSIAKKHGWSGDMTLRGAKTLGGAFAHYSMTPLALYAILKQFFPSKPANEVVKQAFYNGFIDKVSKE